MRRRAPGAVATLTALIALAASPGAYASPSNLNCPHDNAAFGKREVRVGPAWIRAVNVYADPAIFASRYDKQAGNYWAKAPLALRRGTKATVAIAAPDRSHADFQFGGTTRPDVLHVKACRRVPPDRDQGERRFTSWAGGFRLDGPRCVQLVVRQRHPKRVHRAVLSFGMGDTCDAVGA